MVRSERKSSDLLAYAFSTEGSLDPATKLLDVGLDAHTPTAALRTLEEEPLHMSVAVHELTHFASLENLLGHALSFLAMRASTIADAIDHSARGSAPVHPSWIALYAAWHARYRTLLELWRPFLEGLAVYAQIHEANERGDGLIEPLQLLLVCETGFLALNDAPPQNEDLRPAIERFLGAAYGTIRQGARLRHGDGALAAGFEFLRPAELKPYFLGYAYVRGLQVALAQKNRQYENSELFFNLVLRILRSSTASMLSGHASWDQPAVVSRIYGLIDLVRAAPPERVLALPRQPDAVDVVHFLATGEQQTGYVQRGVDVIAPLKELFPEFWNSFESELESRAFGAQASRSDDAALQLSAAEKANQLALRWVYGTMMLNISANGIVPIAGWIPNGLAPLHALALKVDSTLWWLAASAEDIATLVEDTALLPVLPHTALLRAVDVPPTSHTVRLDCYVRYVPAESLMPGAAASQMFPALLFDLANAADPASTLQAEIAVAQPGIVRTHLRVISDPTKRESHAGVLGLRRIVRDALRSHDLADLLEQCGQDSGADQLRAALNEEELAVSRVETYADRRVLRGLLQREPTAADLTLLQRGIGSIRGAAELEPLIVAAYAAPVHIDDSLLDLVQRLNAISRETIGKALFAVHEHDSVVRYQGLWGKAG